MQEMALFFPLARSESDKTYSHSPIIPHKDHSDWSEGVDFLQAKVLQVNINTLKKKCYINVIVSIVTAPLQG